jgi:hypothetical protein
MSCSYFFQGHLEVTLTSDNVPVKDAKILLYGKSKNKESFIGYLFPNKQGKIVTNIDFSKYQSLKIVTTSTGLDKILLPAIEYVTIPHWWQEQVLKLNIILPAIGATVAKNLPIVATESKPSQESEESPPPEVVHMSQLESPLIEEPKPIKSFIIPIFPATFISKKNENKIQNKTITDNFVNYLKLSNFKITADNKPLANAIIYIGYNISQTIKRAGTTNELGEIQIHYNKLFPPDVVIVKKENVITNIAAFVDNASSQSILIDCKIGKSTEFLIQNYAYGISRGFDKTEIFLNGAKQNVSSSLGLLILPNELKPEDNYTIEQKNSILSTISMDDLKKQLRSHNSDEFNSMVLPAIVPFKPTVGFIEPNLTGLIESNMLWRRARREFFSRFINEQSFKTKIQDDLIKITNAKGDLSNDKDISLEEKTLNFFRRGWENSDYAKDIDLLIQIDFIQSEESPTLVGRIYDKSGQIITEQKKSFNENNAEQVASQMYQYLMEQLPIESNVLQQENGIFTLNVGKKQRVKTGDFFVSYIPENFYSIPNKFAGVLKITEVTSDLESKAKAIFGLNKLENNISIRAVRATQSQIDQQIKKRISLQ